MCLCVDIHQPASHVSAKASWQQSAGPPAVASLNESTQFQTLSPCQTNSTGNYLCRSAWWTNAVSQISRTCRTTPPFFFINHSSTLTLGHLPLCDDRVSSWMLWSFAHRICSFHFTNEGRMMADALMHNSNAGATQFVIIWKRQRRVVVSSKAKHVTGIGIACSSSKANNKIKRLNLKMKH